MQARRSGRSRPAGGALACAWALGVALAGPLGAACAVNPVSGRPEFSVVSTGREAQMGREEAARVEQQIGLVRDAALVSWVDSIGQRLARHSPRRDVQYRFFVAHMSEPNAFALPGGYVYVSRGLLAITNSEAELANVVGHEIGHVAARHIAQRKTRAAGVGILTLLGAVAAGVIGGSDAASAVADFGELAGSGLIAAYGRGQEHQADEVGQQLAAEAGWDPGAMTSFLTTLQRESLLRESGARRPSFWDSHPTTGERVQDTAARARTLPQPVAAGPREQAAFLGHLEDLLIGPDPAEGVFRDGDFLHPGLDFSLRFPEDWDTENARDVVLSVSPARDAALLLEIQGRTGDPRDAASVFASANEIELHNARPTRIGGYPAYVARTEVHSQNGTNAIALTWIAHPRGMFRLTGFTPERKFANYKAVLATSAQSFRALTRAERSKITELRMRIVRARSGESLAALGERVGNRWSVDETAVANALGTDVRLSSGQLVKVAVEVPYGG